MKLEVGMYYRYKGIIGKYYKPDLGNNFFTNQHKYTYNEIANYGKFSHNIIDLIEVGDYVNRIRVNEIEKEEDGLFIKIGTITNFISKNEENPYLTGGIDGNNDRLYKLQSIVTKEAFESMSYKVGDFK